MTLKPIMSVNCSKEIFLFCIFLQIENGVFSLPVIVAIIPLLFRRLINSTDTFLKVSSLLFLIKFNLSNIKSLAGLFSIEKEIL